MTPFRLRFLEAGDIFFDGLCTSLVVPTIDGQYGVLANHHNTMLALVTGEVHFTKEDGATQIAAVSDGMMKIENNEVLILVDTAERPEEIDRNRAQRDADMAKEELLQKKSIVEYKSAQARMARAINRLRVKNHGNLQ